MSAGMLRSRGLRKAKGPDWLAVARFEPPAKGQDMLFEVMASKAWRAKPVSLSLFGRGHMEDGMRRLVRRLNLDGRVFFCSYVSNIEKVWADHHALILPSRYEGLPAALVEAILCARPAIVTNVGGNAELIEDGRSGFVAPAPTIKHLNEAMERAWDRRALEPRYSISPPSAPSANGDLNLELFQRLGLPLNLACKRCERLRNFA